MLLRHFSALPPITLGAPLMLRPDWGVCPSTQQGAFMEDAGGAGTGCHLGSQLFPVDGKPWRVAKPGQHPGSQFSLARGFGPLRPPSRCSGIPGGLRPALLSHGQAQAWEGSGAGPLWVLSRR